MSLELTINEAIKNAMREKDKIISGYSIENDYFIRHQECLNIHTKSLALLNIINGEK